MCPKYVVEQAFEFVMQELRGLAGPKSWIGRLCRCLLRLVEFVPAHAF